MFVVAAIEKIARPLLQLGSAKATFSENERDQKRSDHDREGPWTESRVAVKRPKPKIEIWLNSSLFRSARQSGNVHARQRPRPTTIAPARPLDGLTKLRQNDTHDGHAENEYPPPTEYEHEHSDPLKKFQF